MSVQPEYREIRRIDHTAAAPENGGRPRLFYGWIIVALTGVVMTAAYGAQFSFGVFLPYMEADTGWDRELLTRAFSIYIFMYAVLSSISGPLTDRLGPRRVISVGGCLLGAGYWLLSRVQVEWELLLVLGAVAAAGMSASFVPCNTTVVRWFIRHRGRAIGLTTMGASLGNLAAPPLAALLIGAIGWRDSMAWMAAGVTAVIVISAIFIVRDPSEMGLLPDGEDAGSLRVPAAGDDERSWTLAEARRTPAFWLMTAVFFFTWLVVFLPAVHLAAYAMDLGIDAFSAAWVLSSIGLGGVIGRPLIGAVSDRTGRLPALSFVLGTQIIVFLLLPYTDTWLLLCLEAFGFGFGYGGTTTLFPALVGDYFGRQSAGAIVGFIFSISGASAAFGPWLASYVLAHYGSYDLAFWFGAAVNGLAMILVLGLRRPVAEIDPELAAAGAENIP